MWLLPRLHFGSQIVLKSSDVGRRNQLSVLNIFGINFFAYIFDPGIKSLDLSGLLSAPAAACRYVLRITSKGPHIIHSVLSPNSNMIPREVHPKHLSFHREIRNIVGGPCHVYKGWKDIQSAILNWTMYRIRFCSLFNLKGFDHLVYLPTW
jgi:hypothetical protein